MIPFKAERLLNLIECPICKVNFPNANICNICKDHVRDRCPQCRAKYSKFEVRNRLAEQILAEGIFDLSLSCRYFAKGCHFTGKKHETLAHQGQCTFGLEMEAHCPHVYCEQTLNLKQLPGHVAASHKVTGLFEEDQQPWSTETLFKPNNFNVPNIFWSLKAIRVHGHDFYVCRRIVTARSAFQFYVVINARREIAERYQLRLTLGSRDNECTWTGRVFSTTEAKRDIWESLDTFSLTRTMVAKMWISESGISLERRREGYTHILPCDVNIFELKTI